MKYLKITLITLLFILGLGFFSFYHSAPPLISVIMSTYNRANFLPDAIHSILNQTIKNFEFIIVNDGSTDGTADILRNIALKDNRIKVITNKKNIGLIPSLNKALDIAQGSYIARMDDDDISLPERFEHQISFMGKHPDITVTGTTSKANSLTLFKSHIPEISISKNAQQCHLESYYMVPILHPSAMIRHDFIKKHKIRYNNKYTSAEDTDFWHQIALAGGKIVQLHPPLVVRRKSQKKKGYHKTQLESYASYLNHSLSKVKQGYVFQPKWLSQTETCFILNALSKLIPLNSRNPDIITLLEQNKCEKSNWLVLKKNEIYLLLKESKKENEFCSDQNECFSVSDKTSDAMIVECNKTKKKDLYINLGGVWTLNTKTSDSF